MNKITFSGRDLINLRKVAFARSMDKTKRTLSGVILEPRGENDLIAAATDGFILAWSHIRTDGHGLTAKTLIPGILLAEITKKRLHNLSMLVVSDDGFCFYHKAGGLGVTSSHAEAGWNYPAWTKVLPNPTALRPAKPGEVLLSRGVWDKSMSVLNGGKCDHPVEMRDRALIGGDSGPLFTAHEGVFVATMPIKYAHLEVMEKDELSKGLKVALEGAA